ncbi:hypothetical protein FCL40_15605 [Ferrimonas sediminicola]|uniref:Uncharacterized protein n=1 Tax=Ferrimonas sediminicola TaxID=2569538 RepID=A0A4U1BAS0_9GAMM|nr:hypothetical protein [Ferrimonas sediminicola]TKB47635.1 hypothetical protein FCL40_15605 [Ferrimonas sediminicola]
MVTPTLILAAALAAPMEPLPSQMEEISGLAWDGRQLWAHNDSGDGPRLYRFDRQGRYLGRVSFAGADARDWEDITSDGESLFVADCGNNRGNRRDLTIYRAPLPGADSDRVSAVPIHFSFSEQRDFSRKGYTHNFDCEAIVATEESLWVFSKNWGDGQSRVYRLPKEPGEYRSTAIQTLAVHGQITAADWQPQTGRIALLGYRGGLAFRPFIWIARMDERGVDWQSARRYTPLQAGQWEAVTWVSPTTLLLGKESSDVSDHGWLLWQPPLETVKE